MAVAGLSGKTSAMGKGHAAHASGATHSTHGRAKIRPSKINEWRRELNLIPICSDLNNYAHDELWTGAGLSVDGQRPALRGFRKSHHLTFAGPGTPGVLQPE
jgi:hypothetical protein